VKIEKNIKLFKDNKMLNLRKLGDFKHLEHIVNTPCHGGDCQHKAMLETAKAAYDLTANRSTKIQTELYILEIESFLNCKTVCSNLQEGLESFYEDALYYHNIDLCDYNLALTGKHLKGCTHRDHKQTRSGQPY